MMSSGINLDVAKQQNSPTVALKLTATEFTEKRLITLLAQKQFSISEKWRRKLNWSPPQIKQAESTIDLL